ncbi:uncharacterized protein LOC132799973 [Ziziphus jujuba]|uniref:Uncharacterized protein LOC132799973 n=1 Tax=Ziziphus jujuba TaxID=326968 RepID=A0ABM3ZW80_ZIZJJ|nr:uncharacterized protein LOC132799973 [Ziziphus jujuba]
MEMLFWNKLSIEDHQRTVLLKGVLDEGLYRLILPKKDHHTSISSSTFLSSHGPSNIFNSSSDSSFQTTTTSFVFPTHDTKMLSDLAANCNTESSLILSSNKDLSCNVRVSKSIVSSTFPCNLISDFNCNSSSSQFVVSDMFSEQCDSTIINKNNFISVLPSSFSSTNSTSLASFSGTNMNADVNILHQRFGHPSSHVLSQILPFCTHSSTPTISNLSFCYAC